MALKRPATSESEENTSKRAKSESVPTLTIFKKLEAHTGCVSAVRFSPDGRWLASSSSDRTIRLWEAETGNFCKTLEGHALGISDVSWSTDSKFLASASDDKTICVWDVMSGELLKTLKGHSNYVFCLKFNKQSNLLCSGSYDESVRLWDVKEGRCLRPIPAHSDPISSVDFSRDGTLIVSCSYDGLIRIWDTATGSCLQTLDDGCSQPVAFVQFSPNTKFILSASLNNTINLWSLGGNGTKPALQRTYKGHKNEKYCLFAQFYSNKWLISGSEDNLIYMWDVDTTEKVAQFAGHTAPVIAVSVHPNKSLVASCSMDNSIILWKATP